MPLLAGRQPKPASMTEHRSVSRYLARVRGGIGCLALLVMSAASGAPMQRLTLQEAVDLAERNHPQLAAARGQVVASEAERKEAGALLWHNPELTTEVRRRQLAAPNGVAERRRDAAIGLSQTFEIAGQPSARRAAAEAARDAALRGVEQIRLEVRLEAARQFVEALQLSHRAQSEATSAELLKQAAVAVNKRVKAGEDTKLDGNLALVEAERAVAQVEQTRDDLRQAQAALAVQLQLPPDVLPEPQGSLELETPAYRLDELLAVLNHHPKVLAAQAREDAARYRLELERATRHPDVTVGLAHSPERGIDGTDRVTTLSLSVPLPLFRRNEAGIARADAELAQARVERLAAARDVEAAIRVLWQRAERQRLRAQRLKGAVVPALEDNQRLSLAALKAGEVNVTQFLLARRQAIEAQRELAEAQAQALKIRLELEAAAAWPAEIAARNQDAR